MKKLLATILSFLAISQVTHAHTTGHEGDIASSTQHILTQPDHLAAISALATLACLAVWKLTKSRQRSGKN